MRALLGTLIVNGIFLLMQGCTMKGTPISNLGTPQFVSQSQPDSVTETGIGQDPTTGGMFLQWYSTTGASGYKLFRSDTTDVNGVPVNFSLIANMVSLSSLNDTSYVDAYGIQTDIRYYYYLRAYADDGSQSNPSDTIDYQLLSRPSLSYPGANASVDQSGLYFTWIDRTGGGYTVIRVKDITVAPQTHIWVSRRFQAFISYPSKPFNFDSVATGSLISKHSYQWRVDRFNVGVNEGARSAWQTFTIN